MNSKVSQGHRQYQTDR